MDFGFELFSTIGADAVGKGRIGMHADILFNALPRACIVTDFFAPAANRKIVLLFRERLAVICQSKHALAKRKNIGLKGLAGRRR